MPQAKKAKPAPGGDREKTRRVVLLRARVVVLPDGAESAVGADFTDAEAVEAWLVCGEFTGTRSQAIKAYAGEPGTPDAKPGEYKAPPASGLRGGMRYTRPERPLVAAETID